MLKGVKSINQFLTTWMQKNGFDCQAQLGTDFSYDYLNDVITYAIVQEDSRDELFKQLCVEINEFVGQFEVFVLSFFHELGHYATQGAFTEGEELEYMDLLEQLNNKEELTTEDYLQYYSSASEVVATQWAVDYIVAHEEDVKLFSETLTRLVIDFINLNTSEA